MSALLYPTFSSLQALRISRFPSENLPSPTPISHPFSAAHCLSHDLIKNLRISFAKPNISLMKRDAFEQTAIRCSGSSGTSSSSSNSVGISPLLQEFGLSEKESEALLLKNPSIAYASPELLRIRFHSLQSVKFASFAICRLIVRRPEILTAVEIGPFLDFVRDNLEGIELAKLERLLITMEPRFVVDFAEKVALLLDHGVPHEKRVHVINALNLKVFCERGIDETERTIVFLNRFDSRMILRRPMLLNLYLNQQLIPRVRFLTELMGDEKSVEILVKKFPPILSYTVEHLQMHTEFWRSVGLSNEELSKIILVYPGVFGISKEKKLQPRIEFLRECGLNVNDIFRFLTKAPLFLSLSFEGNLSKKLGFLVKLGYENRTRELAMAIGATTRTSCENMQTVIDVLLNYGLSCEDIFTMSKKHPQVLQYNHKSLEKKMEFLIEGMGREIGELLSFPAFLGYKLDERIKWRYEEKKDIRGKGMSINKLLSVSTESFLNKSRKEAVFELDEVKVN